MNDDDAASVIIVLILCFMFFVTGLTWGFGAGKSAVAEDVCISLGHDGGSYTDGGVSCEDLDLPFDEG